MNWNEWHSCTCSKYKQHPFVLSEEKWGKTFFRAFFDNLLPLGRRNPPDEYNCNNNIFLLSNRIYMAAIKIATKLMTFSSDPANIYLFKVNNKYTRKKCGTSRNTRTTSSGVFIVYFEHISHLFLAFLLLTLDKKMLASL